VINSMFANETMRGRNDVVVNAISHDQVRDVLQNHNVELADCGRSTIAGDDGSRHE